MVKDGVAWSMPSNGWKTIWVKSVITEAVFWEVICQIQIGTRRLSGESFNAIAWIQGQWCHTVHYVRSPPQCRDQTRGHLTDRSVADSTTVALPISRARLHCPPDQKSKRHYTLVLKGHIALARAIFPEGSCGAQLDVLARQFLWQHRTQLPPWNRPRHRYYLNVHEGPARA